MIDLKPNTVTNLCCLVTGDRFYFCRDKSKQVWELRCHTEIRVRGQIKKVSHCRNSGGGNVRLFDSNRIVRFLRRQLVVRNGPAEFNIEKYFA
jgi:hypothetical protein